MSVFQIRVVAVCLAINMLGGYDILVMYFSAPFVASVCALNPASTGWSLSDSPIGRAT